jgi:hypothetical protein
MPHSAYFVESGAMCGPFSTRNESICQYLFPPASLKEGPIGARTPHTVDLSHSERSLARDSLVRCGTLRSGRICNLPLQQFFRIPAAASPACRDRFEHKFLSRAAPVPPEGSKAVAPQQTHVYHFPRAASPEVVLPYPARHGGRAVPSNLHRRTPLPRLDCTLSLPFPRSRVSGNAGRRRPATGRRAESPLRAPPARHGVRRARAVIPFTFRRLA